MLSHPRTADRLWDNAASAWESRAWARTWQQHGHEGLLNYSKWNVEGVSNFLDDNTRIIMHNLTKFLHIFGCVAHEWPLVILQWCSDIFKMQTPRSTHCNIPISLLQHFKDFSCWFLDFHAEFNVGALLKFQVHHEIVNASMHVTIKKLYNTYANGDNSMKLAWHLRKLIHFSCCMYVSIMWFIASQWAQSWNLMIATHISEKSPAIWYFSIFVLFVFKFTFLLCFSRINY